MLDSTCDWPPDSDALAAAPDHHRLVLENESVRMLETKIMPGDTVPLHTHRWPSANYFLSFADFVRRDDNGEVMVDSRQSGIRVAPGEASWSAPLPPHTLENVGARPIHVISIEIKRSGI